MGLPIAGEVPMSAPGLGATARLLGLCLLALLGPLTTSGAGAAEWRELESGVDYAVLGLVSTQSGSSGRLHVVRVDPRRARLRALMASALDGRTRTAGSWCEEFGLSAAINLGMYQEDGLSNVGYARSGEHVNSQRWASSFKSALAFAARREDLDPAVLVDLDRDGAREQLGAYDTVIQNLRLIKAPGTNVWSRQERRWSEAALAMDGAGRILFLLTREPFAMWDLNRMLLELPLDIQRAMHLEGGRQASLSIRAPELELDLSGSFDTGFTDNDAIPSQRSIPNVIGVVSASKED
jgi:hypothetical protein